MDSRNTLGVIVLFAMGMTATTPDLSIGARALPSQNDPKSLSRLFPCEALAARQETFGNPFNEGPTRKVDETAAILGRAKPVSLATLAGEWVLGHISPGLRDWTLRVSGGSSDEPNAASERPKILLADDADEHRQTLRAVLEMNGFDVTEAVDGKKALENLTSRRYAALVTDGDMPLMTGEKLIQSLALLDLDLPVVLLSANEAMRSRVAKAHPAVVTMSKEQANLMALPGRLDQLIRSAELRAGAKPKILVIEHEASQRILYRTYLVRAGFQVVEADDGAQAWEAVQTQKFDGVIVDGQMQEIRADEFINKVVSVQPDIPIVIRSASAAMSSRVHKKHPDVAIGPNLSTSERTVETLYHQLSALMALRAMLWDDKVKIGLQEFTKSGLKELSRAEVDRARAIWIDGKWHWTLRQSGGSGPSETNKPRTRRDLLQQHSFLAAA